jgi:hypothetical protein
VDAAAAAQPFDLAGFVVRTKVGVVVLDDDVDRRRDAASPRRNVVRSAASAPTNGRRESAAVWLAVSAPLVRLLMISSCIASID